MLTLPIKKKWYDMILVGTKREEYRRYSPYWIKRFETLGLLRQTENGGYKAKSHLTNVVIFRNGYSEKSPSFKAEVKLSIGEGKIEWGAEEGETYLVLTIIQIHNEYNPEIAFGYSDEENRGKTMDNKQAIEVLSDLQSRAAKGSWTYEALQVAIKALKERKHD